MKKQEGPEEYSSGPSSATSDQVVIRDYWEWSYLGLCRKPSVGPTFFRNSSTIKQAKFICEMCPVIEDCLLWAVIYNEYGVWGGTTDRERSKLYPAKKRNELIEIAKKQKNYYDRPSPGAFLRQAQGRREEQ